MRYDECYKLYQTYDESECKRKLAEQFRLTAVGVLRTYRTCQAWAGIDLGDGFSCAVAMWRADSSDGFVDRLVAEGIALSTARVYFGRLRSLSGFYPVSNVRETYLKWIENRGSVDLVQMHGVGRANWMERMFRTIAGEPADGKGMRKFAAVWELVKKGNVDLDQVVAIGYKRSMAKILVRYFRSCAGIQGGEYRFRPRIVGDICESIIRENPGMDNWGLIQKMLKAGVTYDAARLYCTKAIKEVVT